MAQHFHMHLPHVNKNHFFSHKHISKIQIPRKRAPQKMEVEQKMDSGDILQKQVPLTAEPGDNFRATNLQNHHTG